MKLLVAGPVQAAALGTEDLRQRSGGFNEYTPPIMDSKTPMV